MNTKMKKFNSTMFDAAGGLGFLIYFGVPLAIIIFIIIGITVITIRLIRKAIKQNKDNENKNENDESKKQ